MSGLIIAPASIRPDHVAAVIARLRQFDALLARCPDDPPAGSPPRVIKRIGGKARPFVRGAATRMIVVREAPSFAPDLAVPRSRPRVDVLCYATQEHEAASLAYQVLAALCPGWHGAPFTAANCRIVDVYPVTSGPVPGHDREIGQPFRALSFELDKSELPVEVP